MVFEVGQHISILDENLEGEIIALDQQLSKALVVVDGFEYWYNFDKLIENQTINYSNLAPQNVPEIEKQEFSESIHQKNYDKKLRGFAYKIDLHFHQISLYDHYSAHKKKQLQLEKFEDAMHFCLKHKYRKLEVVHGKGTGVLKAEIHSRLNAYAGIRFHDTPSSCGGSTDILFF